jgi:hypothetical protein
MIEASERSLALNSCITKVTALSMLSKVRSLLPRHYTALSVIRTAPAPVGG